MAMYLLYCCIVVFIVSGGRSEDGNGPGLVGVTNLVFVSLLYSDFGMVRAKRPRVVRMLAAFALICRLMALSCW